MKAVRFYTCQDWKRPHRRWKVIGFLISRDKAAPSGTAPSGGTMARIFEQVHSKASHHGKVMRHRWKHAEKRIISRCKRNLLWINMLS